MSGQAQRVPLTAIVVSRDEGALLTRCLPTVRFCDEILVVDLESQDDTVSVAAANGARVVRRPLVPTVERARAGVVAEARHDWLLFTDPDEELPEALGAQVAELLARVEPEVAVVFGPIRYHFRGRPLRGTVWGGVGRRRLLVRRSGTEFTEAIYSGALPRAGFRSESIPFTGDNAIVHSWATGYRDLLSKHRRYARAAGEDRARAGEITGLRVIVAAPWSSFVDCYFVRRGYLDGLTGLLLSLLWSWFSTSSELALRRRLPRN